MTQLNNRHFSRDIVRFWHGYTQNVVIFQKIRWWTTKLVFFPFLVSSLYKINLLENPARTKPNISWNFQIFIYIRYERFNLNEKKTWVVLMFACLWSFPRISHFNFRIKFIIIATKLRASYFIINMCIAFLGLRFPEQKLNIIISIYFYTSVGVVFIHLCFD